MRVNRSETTNAAFKTPVPGNCSFSSGASGCGVEPATCPEAISSATHQSARAILLAIIGHPPKLSAQGAQIIANHSLIASLMSRPERRVRPMGFQRSPPLGELPRWLPRRLLLRMPGLRGQSVQLLLLLLIRAIELKDMVVEVEEVYGC